MDPYQDIALLYDLEHDGRQDDIDFYLNLVRDEPVLEVGVGTGRIMRRLVEAGFEVWGVDSSPAMLARARERLASFGRAHLIGGSIEHLKLDMCFATILMPLNVLCHVLDPAAQVASLRAVRRHLGPGGLLIIDLSNPLTMADRGANGELRQRFGAWLGDHRIQGFSAAWDDEAAQIVTLCLSYDDTDSGGTVRRSQAELQLRYLYRSELELLLRFSGFNVTQVYGSYDLEKYSSASPNLIALAVPS